MLKISNFEVMGWEHAIRGMRNPMNSWERSDSEKGCSVDFVDRTCKTCEKLLACNMPFRKFVIGPNDLDLMKRLRNGGPVHAKYRRMITVYVDITAPLYWWKEFDTYKIGTVANSCSTMHKIASKEFTLEDFSCEHLSIRQSVDILKENIDALNVFRNVYLNGGLLKYETGEFATFQPKDKEVWWQMIQLLPSSYNQRRTVMLNYEVLANIYKSRRNHKLDEWHTFCNWIEELPYSEIITGYEEEKNE